MFNFNESNSGFGFMDDGVSSNSEIERMDRLFETMDNDLASNHFDQNDDDDDDNNDDLLNIIYGENQEEKNKNKNHVQGRGISDDRKNKINWFGFNIDSPLFDITTTSKLDSNPISYYETEQYPPFFEEDQLMDSPCDLSDTFLRVNGEESEEEENYHHDDFELLQGVKRNATPYKSRKRKRDQVQFSHDSSNDDDDVDVVIVGDDDDDGKGQSNPPKRRKKKRRRIIRHHKNTTVNPNRVKNLYITYPSDSNEEESSMNNRNEKVKRVKRKKGRRNRKKKKKKKKSRSRSRSKSRKENKSNSMKLGPVYMLGNRGHLINWYLK